MSVDHATVPVTTVRSPGSQGEHLLQSVYGNGERADRFYRDQVCNRLLPTMVEFVARMEMMFVATADGRGECDATLRAGPAGFVQVLDETHLAYPEYRGNGVMASLGNISENPHVGLLMVDFVRDLIGLHINGSARIVEDGDLRAAYPSLPLADVPGRRAALWVWWRSRRRTCTAANTSRGWRRCPATGRGAPTTSVARAATTSAPQPNPSLNSRPQ